MSDDEWYESSPPQEDRHIEIYFPVTWGEPPAIIRKVLTEVYEENPAPRIREDLDGAVEEWKLHLFKVLYNANVPAPVSKEFSSHYYAAHISETYGSLSNLSMEEVADQYPMAKSPFLEGYNAYWIEQHIWSDWSLNDNNSKHKPAMDTARLLQEQQQARPLVYDEFIVTAKRMMSAAKVEQRLAKILEAEMETVRTENADLAAKNTSLETECEALEAHNTNNRDINEVARELNETKQQLTKSQRLVKMLLPLVLESDEIYTTVVSSLLKRKLDPSNDGDDDDLGRKAKRVKTK